MHDETPWIFFSAMFSPLKHKIKLTGCTGSGWDGGWGGQKAGSTAEHSQHS